MLYCLISDLYKTNITMSYDVAVVGAGMIGSSCAKYLSAMGLRVLLAGPEEGDKER